MLREKLLCEFTKAVSRETGTYRKETRHRCCQHCVVIWISYRAAAEALHLLLYFNYNNRTRPLNRITLSKHLK